MLTHVRSPEPHLAEAQAADFGQDQQRSGGPYQRGDWLRQDHPGAAVHPG